VQYQFSAAKWLPGVDRRYPSRVVSFGPPVTTRRFPKPPYQSTLSRISLFLSFSLGYPSNRHTTQMCNGRAPANFPFHRSLPWRAPHPATFRMNFRISGFRSSTHRGSWTGATPFDDSTALSLSTRRAVEAADGALIVRISQYEHGGRLHEDFPPVRGAPRREVRVGKLGPLRRTRMRAITSTSRAGTRRHRKDDQAVRISR
jgi:hypothetical protein